MPPTKTVRPQVTGKPSDVAMALFTLAEADVPAHIWGPIGIGKSQIVRQVADVLFAPVYGYTQEGLDYRSPEGVLVTPRDPRPWFVDVRVGLMEPVDAMGMPILKDGVTTFQRPYFLPTDDRGGIVFLDELTRGTTAIQNAMLQFVLDRRVGPHALPKSWRIVAASNRMTDGGGVTKMVGALSERFTDLNMEADREEWTSWALENDIHPMIVAFLRYRPDLFYGYDPAEQANQNPRSWAVASRILHQNPAPGTELMVLAGTIGYGVAGELLAFIKNYRNCISPDAVLADPHNAPVPAKTEASSLFATAAGIARRMDDGNADTFAIYVERLPITYGALVWKDAVARDPVIAHTRGYMKHVADNPEVQ